MVTENEPRLGDVVSKKCPLAVSMRSQGRSVPSIHVISNNMAKGAIDAFPWGAGHGTLR